MNSESSDEDFIGFEDSFLQKSFAMPGDSQLTSLDKNFALKFIPEFDGNRENLHKFISCCDVVSSDLNPLDLPMLMNILKGKLSGAAYNVIKYKTISTWAEMRKVLQEQFLEKRTLTQLQAELVNVKQNSFEDVRSYANRIERLLADLNDACVFSEGEAASSVVVSLNKKTALKAFVDGLAGSLRLIIKASRYVELHDAVEAAVEEEKSFKGRNLSKQNPSIVKCGFCHKPGHNYNNCFLRGQSTSVPKYPSLPKYEFKREPQSPSPRVAVIVCSYCKFKGHHIRDCRKRKFNESVRKDNRPINSNNTGNLQGSGRSSGVTRAVIHNRAT